ncbi:alpha/beta fold hydrolase [Euzebya sp.]|uniref:alpha/beta fold hydrolase n=1 Tax=Euzebya sp. TaxID=1971409 RepID=UPI003511381D
MDSWLDGDPAWAAIREERLIVRGHPVRVLRCDAASGGDDPQLLVHGLGGSAGNWVEVMAPLAELGPVVAVDLPGFGGTPVPDGGSARVTANAAFVAAVARALGWSRFTLHGNSMGGLIATLVAAEHPDLVDRLVLVSPALPPDRPTALLPLPRATAIGVLPMALPVVGRPLVELALTRMQAAGDRVEAEQFLELLFTDPEVVRPELRRALAGESAVAAARPPADRATALATASRSLAAMFLDPRRAMRAIDAVTAPTLVLGGEEDRLIARRVLARAASRRSDWTTRIEPATGHVMMLEHPRRYVDHVIEWREWTDARREDLSRAS